MSEEREQTVDTQEVKAAAQAAVERGENIRQNVRDITLQALSWGHLNVDKVKQVIRAVSEGASIGAEAKGELVRDALTDAMAGMDEALEKSAEASKLAIEETAGHIKDFNSHDLKRALDDLQALEGLFLDTVGDVAKGANELAKQSFDDLIHHARNSGTSVGKTSTQAVTTLNQKLEQTLQKTASAGAHATLEVGSHIAHAAAGFLEGIADTLLPKSKSKPDKE